MGATIRIEDKSKFGEKMASDWKRPQFRAADIDSGGGGRGKGAARRKVDAGCPAIAVASSRGGGVDAAGFGEAEADNA
jgi:hypothetical protein